MSPKGTKAIAVKEIGQVGRGRPRDPDLQDRVFDAAMEAYAQGGWTAFTFEAITRRAGVGKASLYLRWNTREELLRRTLEARWITVKDIHTGTLEDDLECLARMVADLMTGPYGSVFIRMKLDASRFPEVLDCLRPYSEAVIREARNIVQRAIVRNEIPSDVSPGLVMDMLVGGVTSHVIHTPPQMWTAMMRQLDGFLANLTKAVLRGVGYRRRRR